MKNVLLARGAALGCILMGAAPALAPTPPPMIASPGITAGTPAVTPSSPFCYYLWVDGDRI